MRTEQERQDRFVALCRGHRKADQLDRLYQNSWPHGTAYDRLTGTGMTREESFRQNAKSEGFSISQINAYLKL